MRVGAILGSKILKKGVQIGPKLKRGLGTQKGYSALFLSILTSINRGNKLELRAR